MVFEKTLTDLVKGIRASKRDTALYISSCIAEIKSEINSTDPHTKANALQKLTFLQMMGYNMSWASFATIEVMSSARFAHKRIGYLAASQAFTQDTDVILLTTNTLKKELRGAIGPGMNGVYEAGLAINCLSNIVTEDLARELLGDISNLTLHPQPYLRKKAILCLLKIFMKYPHALRLAFPRIQDCLLKDSNSSVTSCAVNVVTELSEVNPKNYLVLAPSFFELLTSSSNNWMLIKVVKLFGTLVPEEPRLARKLLEPLGEIVKNTQAKSLLYEAVYTITLCLPYCKKADGSMPSCVPTIVALCAETLKSFIEEADQNLKYLGLVGFGSLMISHPKVLSAPGYRPLILACLSDDDVTIRTRALDLLLGLATRKNIMDLVTQLLHHVDMATGGYKIDLVEKIIEICSSEKYSLVTDFVWYIDVLVILAKTSGLDGQGVNKRNLGPVISYQISDVTLRVIPVRPYSVRRMIGILLDGGNSKSKRYFSGTFGLETRTAIIPEVLPVAAFIVGEYSTFIDEAVSMKIEGDDDDDELCEYNTQSKGTYHAVIQALTDPSNIDMLSLQTQSIYMQAAVKVFAASTCSNNCHDEELEACIKNLSSTLPVYSQSMDIEVQERAFTAFNLLKSLGLFQNLLSVLKIDALNGHSTSDSKEVTRNRNKINGDLLRLGSPFEISTDISKKSNSQAPDITEKLSPPSSSVVLHARSLSAILKSLFISEQMKPISSKAQRKKRTSVPNYMNSIIEKENSNFLLNLIGSNRNGGHTTGQSRIDSVTFLQQHPLGWTSDRSSIHDQTRFLATPEDSFLTDTSARKNADVDRRNFGPSVSASLNNKQQDPFYLDTHLKVGDDTSKPSNRFDTIQLIDNDSDDSNGAKKRKKKKKGRNKNADTSGDVGALAGFGTSVSSIQNSRLKIPSFQQSLIESDDDDDDHEPRLAKLRIKDKEANLSSKKNLANIDLTTPLREDEVIPEPKHRAVPEHHPLTSRSEEAAVRKKHKKEKKGKAAKDHKGRDNCSQDLLGLADIGNRNLDTASSLQSQTQSNNAINDAFDDLLSLSIPASAPIPSMPVHNHNILNSSIVEPVPEANNPNVLQLWQKASLKCLSSVSSFDWDNIQLFYNLHSINKNDVNFRLKLNNKSSHDSISNVIVSLPGIQDVVINQYSSLDDIHIQNVGPFSSSSMTLKGSLSISGELSKLRIAIPFSAHMSPLQLHKDQITDLLENGVWTSETCKIEIPSSIEGESWRESIQHFLSAAEVVGSRDSSSFMLSSISTKGDKAIFLVKRNKRNIKIDLKATDKMIAKTLASDLKKSCFF